MVQGLDIVDSVTYQELKAKLSEAAELTQHSAWGQLHNLTCNDFQGKTALEEFQAHL